jgi:hypothetical protein
MNAHFKDVEPLVLRDPLAELLGTLDAGEPLRLQFEDAVKAAGYACPVVAGAWLATKAGLRELYGHELPVRGEIEVVIGREAGRMARFTRVVGLLTGAGQETGLSRFSGRYRREALLRHDPSLAGWTRLRRTDTGATADVQVNPEVVLDDPSVQELLARVVRGQASEADRVLHASLWQDKIDRMLRGLEPVVRVRRVAGSLAQTTVMFESPYAR